MPAMNASTQTIASGTTNSRLRLAAELEV
jgi:hypothetical protein